MITLMTSTVATLDANDDDGDDDDDDDDDDAADPECWC